VTRKFTGAVCKGRERSGRWVGYGMLHWPHSNMNAGGIPDAGFWRTLEGYGSADPAFVAGTRVTWTENQVEARHVDLRPKFLDGEKNITWCHRWLTR